MDRKNTKDKYTSEEYKTETYDEMLGSRRKAEQLSYMSVIGKVVRENIVREKKLLQ